MRKGGRHVSPRGRSGERRARDGRAAARARAARGADVVRPALGRAAVAGVLSRLSGGVDRPASVGCVGRSDRRRFRCRAADRRAARFVAGRAAPVRGDAIRGGVAGLSGARRPADASARSGRARMPVVCVPRAQRRVALHERRRRRGTDPAGRAAARDEFRRAAADAARRARDRRAAGVHRRRISGRRPARSDPDRLVAHQGRPVLHHAFRARPAGEDRRAVRLLRRTSVGAELAVAEVGERRGNAQRASAPRRTKRSGFR
ncbi:hypothetical protein BVI434_1990010 [Burkholderia vietnamiensis]|nr:hypothetical protein BVI434_1990010 [Burkholderia vietnamiensis]